ncbi:MAG: hypothetical protein ABMA01_20670, partial [Chthoniobacteraceae bacterium]
IDWSKVELGRLSIALTEGDSPRIAEETPGALKSRAAVQTAYAQADYQGAWDAWSATQMEPANLVELSVFAQVLAYKSDERALGYAERLREYFPGEADAVLAILRWQEDRLEEAATASEAAFTAWRKDPWALPGVPQRLLVIAQALAREDKDPAHPLGLRLHRALSEPFAVQIRNEQRLIVTTQLAQMLDSKPLLLAAVQAWEPHVPWSNAFLSLRAGIYRNARDSRAALADAELDLFLANESLPKARVEPGTGPTRGGSPPTAPVGPEPKQPTTEFRQEAPDTTAAVSTSAK